MSIRMITEAVNADKEILLDELNIKDEVCVKFVLQKFTPDQRIKKANMSKL